MPAPLAMPAMVSVRPFNVTCRVATLGKASVVMMPATAFQKPRGDSAAAAAGMPVRIFCQSGSTPITPVDDGSTSCAFMPSARPTSAQVSRASVSPGRAVEALAFPLLTTMACKRPARMTSSPMATGAAFTLFVVNAATAVAGTSDTSSDKSFLPLGLSPHATPENRKPGITIGDFLTDIFILCLYLCLYLFFLQAP